MIGAFIVELILRKDHRLRTFNWFSSPFWWISPLNGGGRGGPLVQLSIIYLTIWNCLLKLNFVCREIKTCLKWGSLWRPVDPASNSNAGGSVTNFRVTVRTLISSQFRNWMITPIKFCLVSEIDWLGIYGVDRSRGNWRKMAAVMQNLKQELCWKHHGLHKNTFVGSIKTRFE